MEPSKGVRSIIYFASGGLDGLEDLMRAMPGTLAARGGYVSGIREAVAVERDPERTSPDALILAYFHAIGHAVPRRRTEEPSYPAWICCTDAGDRAAAERLSRLELGRREDLSLELPPLSGPLDLEARPRGASMRDSAQVRSIPTVLIRTLSALRIDPGRYRRPEDEAIRRALTPEWYRVTQENGTEPAFENAFCELFVPGLYVDVVTGEPLFSSSHKFPRNCGWPTFTQPIEKAVLFLLPDRDCTAQAEVRSRVGDSHLGYVFYGEPSSPTDVCYCINSASLRFVPLDRMEAEGYGFLVDQIR